MRKGKNTIIINAENFIKGMSISKFLKTGGFSPETGAVNLLGEKGVLHPMGAFTDASTNLTDQIIASCEDPSYLGSNRLFLDDSGSFYTFDGTTLTKQATTSADLFTKGTTDFIPFGAFYYATTKAGLGGDIVRWNKSATLVENWWTSASYLNQPILSTLTAYRPLLVWEKHLWVGDKNKLHRIADDLTVSNGQLTLTATETITALGIDKITGRMLVATNVGANYSAIKEGSTSILIYDGASPLPLKVVPIKGIVLSFKNLGNTTFVFFKDKVGIWTGEGVKFVRKLGVNFDGTQLPYKHNVAAIDNTLYVIEKTKVLAIGEIMPGTITTYYAIENTINSAYFTSIAPIGNQKLAVSFATAKLYTYNTTDVSAYGLPSNNFYSNWYSFEKDIYVRTIKVQYSSNLSLATNYGIPFLNYAKNQSKQFPNVVGKTTGKWEHEINGIDIKTDELQFEYNFYPNSSANVGGIKRIIITYDPAE